MRSIWNWNDENTPMSNTLFSVAVNFFGRFFLKKFYLFWIVPKAQIYVKSLENRDSIWETVARFSCFFEVLWLLAYRSETLVPIYFLCFRFVTGRWWHIFFKYLLHSGFQIHNSPQLRSGNVPSRAQATSLYLKRSIQWKNNRSGSWYPKYPFGRKAKNRIFFIFKVLFLHNFWLDFRHGNNWHVFVCRIDFSSIDRFIKIGWKCLKAQLFLLFCRYSNSQFFESLPWYDTLRGSFSWIKCNKKCCKLKYQTRK